jgi:hypothetical protein
MGATEDKLLQQLDADFEATVAKDPNQRQVREAAGLLEGLSPTSDAVDKPHRGKPWTDALRAVAILRQARSKAAVPLLLKYMVLHADVGNAHILLAEYADVLAILTGRDVENPNRSGGRDRKAAVRGAVAALVENWWTPNQGKITTDLDQMTGQQRELVVDRLLRKAAHADYLEDRHEADEATAYRLHEVISYRVLGRSSHDRAGWYAEELRPALLPAILARVGYAEQPTEETRARPVRIPFSAIGMLAQLRRDGGAKSLAAIADDARQNAAARLACVLALHRAGEELKLPVLLSILKTEADLENRLVAILALGYSEERTQTGAVLVELLDDPNIEIRTAAVCALRGCRPGSALPKLKKMVDHFDPRQGAPFIFDTLGEYRTKEANAILVDFLRATLEDGRNERYLLNAVSALEKATGQRWCKPGAQPVAVWRQEAKAAVQWWDSGGKSEEPAANPLAERPAPPAKHVVKPLRNSYYPEVGPPGDMTVRVRLRASALLGDRLAMIILGELWDRNDPRLNDRAHPGMTTQSVGYYATISLRKEDAEEPEYELLGPLWDCHDIEGERIEGKIVYDTRVAAGHPMMTITPRRWGWFQNGQVQTPWLYALEYFELREQRGLVRWSHLGEPTDHRLGRRMLEAPKRRWSAAETFTLGETMRWQGSLVSDRYVFQGGRAGGEAAPLSIYDTLDDRFVDDRWLCDLVQEVAGWKWLAGKLILSPDRNWLVVVPVDFWDDDRDSQPPEEIEYGDMRLRRKEQYLLFHRGTAKPTLFNRIPWSVPHAPEKAIIDNGGELLLLFGGGVLVPFKSQERMALRGFGGTHFDPTGPALVGWTASDRGNLPIAEGGKVGFMVTIDRWKYLEDRRETVKVRIEDMFEIHGRKIVPGRKEASPITE